ncbi:MAG: hypothetical protein ACK5WS_06105 [Alphaproteobacteria bacterium]|jgi:hypothetical protein|nr:hypothetical protein [Candidatus Jidaibacter sp.]
MATNIAIADPAREEILPWQQLFLRDDVKKVFSIQLPEKYILKLKYISNKTNISQQKLARDILCKEIDNLLEELDVRS